MSKVINSGLAGLVLAGASFLDMSCNSANQPNTSKPGVIRTSEFGAYETPEQFKRRLVEYSDKNGISGNNKEVEECADIYRSIYLSTKEQKKECLEAYTRVPEWILEKYPFLDLKNPAHQMFIGYIHERDKAIGRLVQKAGP